ncbi:MAG: class I SAM-dependent methyltransferase [Pseudomonadales bacterium]
MSQEDQLRWNRRFAEGAYDNRVYPSTLLVAHEHLLAKSGKALDVACGAGRNTRFLLEKGYTVTALDISDIALQQLQDGLGEMAPLTCLCHDLDKGLPPLANDIDLIIKMRFLNEALIPTLCEHLGPSGLLICEVFMQTKEKNTIGPSGERFRIQAGALENAVRGLNILHLHEGPITDPDGRIAVVAQVIAQAC